MKIKLSLSIALMLIISSCNSKKGFTENVKSENTTEMKKMTNSHNIKLNKGELFLVAIADQKEGKDELLQEYFGTIMPSAMKNGFTPLGQLHIDKIVRSDDFTPNNFIGLFKWPNMDSVQAFMSEFSPEQLKRLRQPIWNEFKAHMVAIQEDKNLLIDQNKLYEVKTIWSKVNVTNEIIKENGGKIILNEPIVGYDDLNGNKAPNYILIIEWDDIKMANNFNKLHSSKSLKAANYYTHFTLFP